MGPLIHAPKLAHKIPLHQDSSQTAALISVLIYKPFYPHLKGGHCPATRQKNCNDKFHLLNAMKLFDFMHDSKKVFIDSKYIKSLSCAGNYAEHWEI